MGVDFYACDRCGESRYEEYVHHCDKCDHSLCTRCLVNDDVNSSYAHHYCVKFDGSDDMKEKYGIDDEAIKNEWVTLDEIIDDTGIDPKYCPFCQGTSVAREDVLDYLIAKNGWDYDDLKREYLAQLKEERE